MIINRKVKKTRLYKSIMKKFEFYNLTEAARKEHRKDSKAALYDDPGGSRAINEAIEWIVRAQKNSASKDGGVARHYSLHTGWSSSYPETTGYIIPTVLDYAEKTKNEKLRLKAKKMLDWLCNIQMPNGAFKGGMIDQSPTKPVVFNTGQILLGLARGVVDLGENYRKPMIKAADWLVKVQSSDGCWRKYPSPFTPPGEKTYDTHVAWGLLEAARVESKKAYALAAVKNVKWTLGLQKSNGWIDKCCLSDRLQPLTHTMGYALRGIVEAYRFSQDKEILRGALRTADGLLESLKPGGFLPGRLNSTWEGTVSWTCLTGSVQIAICWLILYQITEDEKYRKAACEVNRFVRRTMKPNGAIETRGGIKGSFPVSGGYCPYQYLNWACKFFIDANMIELSIT